MIVRKLWPWEWEQLRAHLLRLTAEDRRFRFCRVADDDYIHRYCDRIDRTRTTVVGCFADGALRGVAELVQIPEGVPVGAEIALSVERTYQCQGIGAKLLQKALLLARNRFCDTVFLLALRENGRLIRLAARFGAVVTACDATAEGHVRLPWPNCSRSWPETARRSARRCSSCRPRRWRWGRRGRRSGSAPNPAPLRRPALPARGRAAGRAAGSARSARP